MENLAIRQAGRVRFCRPQEGLFGLKEWEEEGFVPDPVTTVPPLLVPQPPGVPCTRRLRGASTRVGVQHRENTSYLLAINVIAQL